MKPFILIVCIATLTACSEVRQPMPSYSGGSDPDMVRPKPRQIIDKENPEHPDFMSGPDNDRVTSDGHPIPEEPGAYFYENEDGTGTTVIVEPERPSARIDGGGKVNP